MDNIKVVYDVMEDACFHGKLDTVQYCVGTGVNISSILCNIFNTACWRGHLDIAKYLNSIKGNTKLDLGATLMYVCDNNVGTTDVKEYLVEELGVVNALRIACQSGNDKAVEYLLNKLGIGNALRIACLSGNVKAVEHIVEQGVELEVLHEAMKIARDLGQLSIVNLLFQACIEDDHYP